MKALLVNGSPRGEASNTLRISRAFAGGLGCEVREVTLAGAGYEPCRGCFSCWGETAGTCVLRDGMDEVLDLVRGADVLIQSFPLYFCGLPAVMKTFVDRMLPLTLPYLGRPMPGGGQSFLRLRDDAAMRRKKLVLIAACGWGETEGMFAGVRAQYDAICGRGGWTPVFVPQGELYGIAGLEPQIRRHLERFRAAGAEFAAAGALSPETAAALSETMLPARAYEKISLARWGDTAGER